MFKSREGFTAVKASILIAVVALLIVLVGVWYVSKNKTGADIMVPGKISTSTPKIGGSTTTPKIGMGAAGGIVYDVKEASSEIGKVIPAIHAQVLYYQGSCSDNSGDEGVGVLSGVFYTDWTHADSKGSKAGWYLITPIPPGLYCAYAFSGAGKVAGISEMQTVVVPWGGDRVVDFYLKLPNSNGKIIPSMPTTTTTSPQSQ